jgi:putative colanic acid biosynthesis UDP-glucose lipid carrier transferase
MNYAKRDFNKPQGHTFGPHEASPQRLPKWTISYRAVAPIAMAFDALIILLMSLLSGVAYNFEVYGRVGNIEPLVGFGVVVAALFIALGKNRNLYILTELLNFKSQVRQVAVLWLIVLVFFTAVSFIMKAGESFSRGTTLSFAVSGFIMLIIARGFWRIFLANGLAGNRFSGRKVAVISEQSPVDDSSLVEVLARHGLQIATHFTLPAGHHVERRWKEIIAQTISSVRGSDIEEVVVSANLVHWSKLNDLMRELRVLPLPVNFIPVGPMSGIFKLTSFKIGDTVAIEMQRGPRSLLELAIKRIIDVLTAGLGILLFLPLFLMTAVAIKLDSPGPIIFRQRRCGFNRRPFEIFKFRTMSVQENDGSIIQAKPDDIRVTRIGRLLRRSSIDELPQLLNVLQGTMSIIGPRPHAMAHDDKFDKLVGNYAYRQHVKPGLTGWAQVNGHRGETRTITDMEDRIKLDLWYIDNWSLMLDFKITFMTIFEIIRGTNAY